MKTSKCCKAKIVEHAQMWVRGVLPKELHPPNYVPEGRVYPLFCSVCHKQING